MLKAIRMQCWEFFAHRSHLSRVHRDFKAAMASEMTALVQSLAAGASLAISSCWLAEALSC